MEVYEILKRPQEIQYEIRGKMAMREECIKRYKERRRKTNGI